MTIADFEQGKRSPLRNNLVMIRQAFEQQGITFIDENGGPAGLREPRAVIEPQPESSSTPVAQREAETKKPARANARQRQE